MLCLKMSKRSPIHRCPVQSNMVFHQSIQHEISPQCCSVIIDLSLTQIHSTPIHRRIHCRNIHVSCCRYFLALIRSLDFPLLSAERASILRASLLQPLHDAVHMEMVIALAPNWRAFVSRHFTVWTSSIKWLPANTAVLLFHFPFPDGHRVPMVHLDFDWHLRSQTDFG